MLIVGGAAVNEWLKAAHGRARRRRRATRFRAAFAETDAATRAALLGDVAGGDARAAVLARLAEAGA